MVVAMHATLSEATSLFICDDAGADGHVETSFLAHDRHQLENALHGSLIRTTNGQHDAELAGAERRRFAGRFDDLGSIEERRGLHRGFELGRLRTEMAVLGAAAGLGRQNAFDLDGVATPLETNVVGERGQCGHRGVGHIGKHGEFIERQLAALIKQSDARRAKCFAGCFDREPGPLGHTGIGAEGDRDVRHEGQG